MNLAYRFFVCSFCCPCVFDRRCYRCRDDCFLFVLFFLLDYSRAFLLLRLTFLNKNQTTIFCLFGLTTGSFFLLTLLYSRGPVLLCTAGSFSQYVNVAIHAFVVPLRPCGYLRIVQSLHRRTRFKFPSFLREVLARHPCGAVTFFCTS